MSEWGDREKGIGNREKGKGMAAAALEAQPRRRDAILGVRGR